MSYRKFADTVPRVFILESNYWLDGACKRAAERMGWAVGRAPVVLGGSMPREMVAGLLQSLAEFRPDFILSVNLSGMDDAGLFARLFADLGIPSAAWFVDDPRTILMDRTLYASPLAVGITWEASYREYLLQCGFAEAHTLPLAVDDTLFNAPPADSWSFPPAFVGHSMTEFAAREWAWVEERPHVAHALHAAFDAGRITRENFACGIEAMLGGGPVSGFDPDERRHAEMVCFIEGTRRLRLALIETLTPEGICACGDEAWQQIAPYWSGTIDYETALPSFYRQCEVNLNTTSLQMATTVNQRVFDCPAAGGFLLTDAQPALGDLFDVEHEMAIYHDLDEALDLLRFYHARPEARRPLIEAARKRILGEHTYRHRLERLADIMRSRFAG